MLKVYNGDFPYFECSQYGKHVEEIDDKCPYCQHWFNEVKVVHDNELQPRNNYEEDEFSESDGTRCIVHTILFSGGNIFAQLKIDNTPSSMLCLPMFHNN